MWNSKPTAATVAKWFKGFDLPEGMKHDQYISGIVVIPERGTHKPFVTAPTRIKFFNDWCMVKGYSSILDTSDPTTYTIDYGDGKSANLLVVRTKVMVRELDANGDAKLVCSAVGSKSVAQTKKFKGTLYPDDTALMKAETGSVARAVGMLGMLTLPGSGVATAEDMVELEAPDTTIGKPAPAAKKASDPRAGKNAQRKPAGSAGRSSTPS